LTHRMSGAHTSSRIGITWCWVCASSESIHMCVLPSCFARCCAAHIAWVGALVYTNFISFFILRALTAYSLYDAWHIRWHLWYCLRYTNASRVVWVTVTYAVPHINAEYVDSGYAVLIAQMVVVLHMVQPSPFSLLQSACLPLPLFSLLSSGLVAVLCVLPHTPTHALCQTSRPSHPFS
jgi:hypothetical protein